MSTKVSVPTVAPSRRVSYDMLCKVELDGLHSDDAVNSSAVAYLDPRDRHLTTELIMGSLRWQGALDHVLEGASSRPWPKVDPRLRILLRMSLYQMWQLDRIPDHALVNDAVSLAKGKLGRGAGSFVNAVLRRVGRERPWENQDLVDSWPPWTRVSLPEWLWKRWVSRFGELRAYDYAASLNTAPQATFRVPKGRQFSPFSSGTEMQASELVPGAYWLPRAGLRDQGGVAPPKALCFQDEASQLIPWLLGDILGWALWDVCAAPGGKSSILRERCGERGFVLSSDVSLARCRRLAQALSDVRGGRSEIVQLDARATPPFRLSFDAVVVDVPCSGLGTLRRNPEIKWCFKEDQLQSFRGTQEAILNSVSHAVRAGGYLLYSTCSTEPEENEDVVHGFLARRPQFALVRPCHPGAVESLLDAEGMVRTFPGTRLWDGFYAALMFRVS